MNQKPMVFVNHRDTPAWLALVVSMVALIIPVLWAVMVFLAMVWLINILWLEPEFSLINEYKSLMKSLKKYDKNQAIEWIFSGWNPTSPPSHILARQYFDSKRKDIDRKSNELNKKLDRIINFRYCLITTDSALIGKEFAELFIDIKTLYEHCGVSMDSEFILALKDSRNHFTEIEKAISEDLVSCWSGVNPYR
jgi:hypothetical protein